MASVTRESLLDMCDDLSEKHQKAADAVNLILRNLPWWVPEWAARRIIDKWNVFNKDMASAIGEFRSDVSSVGDPISLRDAADDWTQRVSAPLAGLASTISTGKLRSDDVFSGIAAEAYRSNIVPVQGEAVESIRSNYVPDLSSFLDGLAEADENYQHATWVMVVALIAAVVTFIVGAATIETVVGAVVALVALIGELAVFVATALSRDADFESAISTALGTLDALLLAFAPFEGGKGGKWPQAVFG